MAIEPGEALIWKYANKQCTIDEIEYIESWLAADPENLRKFQRIQLYISMNPNENHNPTPENLPEEEKSSYQNYLSALIILLIVFALLGVYAIINSK